MKVICLCGRFLNYLLFLKEGVTLPEYSYFYLSSWQWYASSPLTYSMDSATLSTQHLSDSYLTLRRNWLFKGLLGCLEKAFRLLSWNRSRCRKVMGICTLCNFGCCCVCFLHMVETKSWNDWCWCLIFMRSNSIM